MKNMENATQRGLFLFYSDREAARPEPVGFRYWRTPENTPSVLRPAPGSLSSEGGQNGPQARDPKAEMDTGHAGPHPVLRDPTRRRGSAPDSSSSSISSITITSRKVTQISKPLCPTMNDLAGGRRKALVVKVIEQRTKSTSSRPIVSTSGSDHEEIDHSVVLRRKATIVKMTEQRERFSPAQYRHSYTEGINQAQLTDESKVNPSPLNQNLTISLKPGARSQHRSSLSLCLNNLNTSSTAGEKNTQKYKPPRRPLSCDASLFNSTEAVTHPAFHNKISPASQKTNIDLVSSSSSEARRCSASSGEDGSARKEGLERDRKEPISAIKPLTLLKAADNSADLSADAVLALNAAAVIANIKLRAQQRPTTSHTATAEYLPIPLRCHDRILFSLSVSLTEVRGQSEHRELKEEAAGANGKDKTCPEEQCVDFVPFESENDLSETALAPLSLSEALAIRRPGFIQRSQARVRALERRSQERQTPESGECLVKSKDRSIMGKSLQLWSRRSYNQLPEVKKRREEEKRRKEEEKRKLASRTNRLRAELFKKKLLEQILQRGGNH
ncbi:MAP7 domain-containing protein 2-like [Carassius auratus]|uniref:MAP7 domain-containing protein 2-like n=1 Tax=Carassius auratus TaxID=7957 RepID=A0A6P6NLA7_CARAU|nr:MAP7 domain-containing protein 2-like [Carassius auratus]